MKNKRIISINFVIILLVLGSVIFYARIQERSNYNTAVMGFENSAVSIEKVIESHMNGEQRVVNVWANVINSGNYTMEEAIDFTKKSLGNSVTSVHIIWDDTYEGLSTQAHTSNPEDFSVSYSDSTRVQVYEMTPIKVIRGLNLDVNGIHMTSAYTNPVTGSKVISFSQKIRLIAEDGKFKEAILIFVIPVNYLNEKWIFSTDYSDLSLALIEKNGTYIIQPSSMKNSSFYEFIYSYNSLPQELLNQRIFGRNVGSFVAYNSKGERNRYAHVVIKASNCNHAIILGIRDSSLGKQKIDWFVLLVIVISLGFTFAANLVYFLTATTRENNHIKTIEKQKEALEVALEKAQAANNSKTVFLNNVSHDIRTPMNAIMGYTNLAFASINDGNKMYDYLMKISTSSSHLLDLINDVLDMGRIESGKLELVEKETNLVSLRKEIETVFDAEIKNKRINFKIDSTALVHPDVFCDRLRLKQILCNLLSNAIKFTKENGYISFTIGEIAGTDEGYAIYEFRVKDTGIGMSPEFAKKIYEPFERERTSTVSGIQGTGLGMAITKNLINMMKGDIQLETKLGIGTEFIVRLSFRINYDAVEVVEEPAIVEVSKNVSFTGKRVLLVEDNELNQEIAMSIFEEMGLTVELANDGLQAVESVIQNETGYYDIVFMDIMMPEMNGYEATKAIRNIEDVDKANVPIVAMTANAFEEDKNLTQKAGMDGYVAKPINIAELTKVLQNFLEPIEELEDE